MPRIEDEDDDLQDDDQGGDEGSVDWRSRLLTWGLAGAALLVVQVRKRRQDAPLPAAKDASQEDRQW